MKIENVFIFIFVTAFSVLASAQWGMVQPYPKTSLDVYTEITGLDFTLEPEPFSGAGLSQLTSLDVARKNSLFLPFGLTQGELTTIAIASSVAVIFFANDREISEFVQRNNSDVTEDLSGFGEILGNGGWGVAGAGAGLIVGVVIDNQKVKRISLMAAKAALIAGLATYVVKQSFHRARPSESDDPYEFHGPGIGSDNISFASGHTAQAFAVATVIAESSKGNGSKVIPVLAYSLAALAGYSRVHSQDHWASDVVVGALIGHLAAKSVMNTKMSKKGFIIVPTMGVDGSAYLDVTYRGKEPELKCGEGLQGVEAFRDCMEKALSR